MREQWRIPGTWQWTTLGEVTQVVGGGTPRTAEPDYWNGDIPWVTPADLSGYDRKRIGHGGRSITGTGLARSAARLLPTGTVLFSSRAPIGYVAIAANPIATNQGFKSFVPPPEIRSCFLYYYLRFAKFLAVESGSGTTFKELSKKRAELLPFPLAPLSEQHRIVARIDSLFAKLDEGIAALERTRSALERYRASVLKAAVEGRLTEQWRKENPLQESGEELLERILAERRMCWEDEQLAKFEAKGKRPPKKWKEKYKEPVKQDARNLPRLPDGWCWATVDQVSMGITYGSSAKTSPDFEGIPVLRMGNIQVGALDLANLKYLPLDHSEFPKLLLANGDVLFNRTNSAELVGKTAVYRGRPAPCSFASYLISVRLIRPRQAEVVADALNSAWGRAWIASVVSQQVGQANVNGTKLRAFPFPLPPETEQEEIMRRSGTVAESVTRSNGAITAFLRQAIALRQSILRRAMEGRLVAQDPEDEPASVLLERIRTEREAGKKKRHPTRRNRTTRTKAP